MRPPDAWMFPFDPSDGSTSNGFAQLTLHINGADKFYPEATEFDAQEKSGKESRVGDRVLVGNNLPGTWYNNGEFVSEDAEQEVSGFKWDSGEDPRTRKTHVETLSDLGNIDRDGFWETQAAQQPLNALDGVGGLRLVTSGGIYLPFDDNIGTGSNIVWSDNMPQPSDPQFADYTNHPNYDKVFDEQGNKLDSQSDRPYLKMRATAAYHYRYQNGEDPIACISNFYDPTNSITARNRDGLADVSGEIIGTKPINTDGANSNNGITYAPFSSQSNNAQLQYQADLVYPNGRLVNPILNSALAKTAADRTLSEQASIDATSCALQIYDGTLTPSTTPTTGYPLPNGTIKEVTLLDGRQAKNIDNNFVPYDPTDVANTGSNSLDGRYDYSVEEREPLEIRTTVLDLDLLRQQTADGSTNTAVQPQEYLLPNSGIIYATRDDALPDTSDVQPIDADTSNSDIAATDFKLDPTRRPNGIMLINGRRLWREQGFREVEKGLILASNLPVYVKGEFNPHKDSSDAPQEEFSTPLAGSYSNFYTRSNLNENFACRNGDPRLPPTSCASNAVSDEWRPATVLSDAISLLSDDYREGFRNEGDYDLRNNRIDQITDPDNDATDEIDSAAEIASRRERNGFFNNDFAINGLSSRAITVDGITPQDSNYVSSTGTTYVGSSYFNNFVTPVQRRAFFDEYLMEYCPKLPVSECEANDWIVAPGVKASDEIGNNFNISNHLSGTTAAPPDASVARYARRVAFKRKASGILELSDWDGEFVPIPLGINTSSQIAEFPYRDSFSSSGNNPRNSLNSLWFRTTSNTNGDPSSNPNYDDDRALSYLPPSVGGGKLILPDTECFSESDVVACTTTNPPSSGTVNLNLPTTDKASDYLYCLDSNSNPNAGNSKNYQVNTIGGTAACPKTGSSSNSPFNDPRDAISDAQSTMLNFAQTSGLVWPTSGINVITAVDDVNVIEIAGNSGETMAAGTEITLKGSDSDIFVLQANGTVEFEANTIDGGFQLNLDGINPNNVFWVFKSGAKPEFTGDTPTNKPHIIAGNLIGSSGQAKIGDSANTEVRIEGGRYLGFTTVPNINGNFTFTAVTADAQPLLVPVLNIQYPGLSPTNTSDLTSPNGQGTRVEDTRWQQPVTSDTIFNLVLATGDGPTHPAYNFTGGPNHLGADNGGVINLPRFLQNWGSFTSNTRDAVINGSLIQLKRSSYATGPIASVPRIRTDSTSILNGGIFNYPQIYTSTNFSGRSGFYVAPGREWGFDVGLLSQIPDLFARQFTLKPTEEPNDFFREASRDDQWIQTLLCAKLASDDAKIAINSDQRPTNFCTANTGG